MSSLRLLILFVFRTVDLWHSLAIVALGLDFPKGLVSPDPLISVEGAGLSQPQPRFFFVHMYVNLSTQTCSCEEPPRCCLSPRGPSTPWHRGPSETSPRRLLARFVGLLPEKLRWQPGPSADPCSPSQLFCTCSPNQGFLLIKGLVFVQSPC